MFIVLSFHDCYYNFPRSISFYLQYFIIFLLLLINIIIIIFLFFYFSQSRYNKTPVIKASGRELCYVLLTGILCCYCMSYVILAPPNVLTCALLRIGIGLCLSICYSAIFIKTNRISRIFNQGVKSIQRPLYTSPLSQVTISSCKLIYFIDFLGSFPEIMAKSLIFSKLSEKKFCLHFWTTPNLYMVVITCNYIKSILD